MQIVWNLLQVVHWFIYHKIIPTKTSMTSHYTVLKIKILLVPVNWSLWHNPVGQATYHDGHKIAFSLWPRWIRTVECGILVIKKNFCKKFTNWIIFSLFNVPMKHVHKKEKQKEIWLWKKNNLLLSPLLFNFNIEKTSIMICYANFVSWIYIYFG